MSPLGTRAARLAPKNTLEWHVFHGALGVGWAEGQLGGELSRGELG